MLITIDTQRIAEILESYVNGRMECKINGDAENAKLWQDKFDRSTDFLKKLGIDAYHDEDIEAIRINTEDVHLLR